LVGLGEPDDAAVFRLDNERALIKTTDFFSPVVDDPWTYGAIAAVNAMSDVYAMGGEVLFCLNIAGFPRRSVAETCGADFRRRGLQGARGRRGHCRRPHGDQPRAVLWPERDRDRAPRRQIMRKGGARSGDALFLTKPLGTGIITTAAKRTGSGESAEDSAARQAEGKPDLEPRDFDAALDSMLRLNRGAAQAGKLAGVRSATDITGYGLLGHGSEMAIASGRECGAGFVIHAGAVPTLPGVWMYIAAGYLTSGSRRNPSHYGEHVTFAPEVTPAQRTLLWEVETSGGLLLAVPPGNVDIFTAACAERKQACWRIGEVVAREGIEVV
jgi:selenide,water dikinase